MHLPPLIHDLTVILIAAATVSFIFHWLRLPVILGYVIAGIVVGPHVHFFPTVTDMPNIEIWGELGVIFLMFTLGLDFSFRKLAAVGVRATFTGAFEVTCMFILGFGIAQLLQWDFAQSVFLGATLSISSTTIIVKSLENLDLARRRFREHVFGILVIEDLAAILLLVALTSLVTKGEVHGLGLLLLLAQMLLVVAVWMLVGFFLVPRFLSWAARLKSNELLIILSLGLCLMLVSVGARFGYSLALGAFIMGSIIGETRESRKIEELIRPFRDLFVAIFFVSIGMRVNPQIFLDEWWLIILMSAIIVVGKILFVGIGSVLSGQRLRHSIQSAFAMTQIGEFSFLIAGFGLKYGITDEKFYSSVVAASLITTLTTPLFMRMSEGTHEFLEKHLSLRMKETLERYASVWQPTSGPHQPETKVMVTWVANAVLVTAVFIISASQVRPQLYEWFDEPVVAQSLAWLFTCILTAHFLWAMGAVFRHSRNQGIIFLSRFLTLVLVAALSTQFLSAWTTLLIASAVFALLILLVYPKLEASYGWFETQFLASFKKDTKHRDHLSSLQRLAPWESHLTQLHVHPDSEIIGHNLLESKLRERFGLNIVAIQRGSRVIVAPTRDERIFPEDELLVLANDEQMEAARKVIEASVVDLTAEELTDFDIKLISVTPESPFCEKSILSSQLREKHDVLVVGIERNGQRIMNPESHLIIKPGDLMWIVGSRNRLRELS
jgi:monovalent cation:H+ antiporter-2, CPA2 family